MTLQSDWQQLQAGRFVTLFDIDLGAAPKVGTSSIVRLTPYKNVTNFQGNSYTYHPISISGIISDLTGQLPEPTLALAPEQTIKDIRKQYRDLRGARIRYIVATSDLSKYKEQHYFVDSISRWNKKEIGLTLTVAMGLEALRTRSTRQMASGQCILKYRIWNGSSFTYTPLEDGGCPWGQATGTGTPYIKYNNDSTSDGALDNCNKTLSGCVKRWDPNIEGKNLPYTGNVKGGTSSTGDPCNG